METYEFVELLFDCWPQWKKGEVNISQRHGISEFILAGEITNLWVILIIYLGRKGGVNGILIVANPTITNFDSRIITYHTFDLSSKYDSLNLIPSIIDLETIYHEIKVKDEFGDENHQIWPIVIISHLDRTWKILEQMANRNPGQLQERLISLPTNKEKFKPLFVFLQPKTRRRTQ